MTVVPQNSIRNLRGRSVRLDALCKLGNGKLCNIEIQKADNDDHLRRVRYNAACITANVTTPGEKFKNIPDVIVICISQNDFLKSGKTIYHVKKLILETGEVIDDGETDIFVNTEINDGSEIAALMKCFLEKYPDDPKFPKLQQQVAQIKGTEGGISAMCEIMEQYAKEYARESNIKAFVEACKIYKDTIDGAVQKIMAHFGLSKDDAVQKVSQYWGG